MNKAAHLNHWPGTGRTNHGAVLGASVLGHGRSPAITACRGRGRAAGHRTWPFPNDLVFKGLPLPWASLAELGRHAAGVAAGRCGGLERGPARRRRSPSFRSQPSRSGLKNVCVRSLPSSSGILNGSFLMLSYKFCEDSNGARFSGEDPVLPRQPTRGGGGNRGGAARDSLEA